MLTQERPTKELELDSLFVPDYSGKQTWLAIVGSVHFSDPFALTIADRIIREEIEGYKPTGCVSGGADGIDTRFKTIARQYGFKVEDGTFVEYLPQNKRWQPSGYKARNILIAKKATRLVAIRSSTSTTYGSGWTADYAESIGKDVRREIL